MREPRGDPPVTLYRGVRQTLLDIAASRQLQAERITLKAQISRLPDPDPLLRVVRMLAVAGTIDVLLGVLLMAGDAIWAPLVLMPNIILLPLAFRAFPRWLSRSEFTATNRSAHDMPNDGQFP